MLAGHATAQTFTTLYSFTDGNNGYPNGALVLSGNTLYGSDYRGGSGDHGTVFAVNTDGTDFTTLYSFTNGSDGANPEGDLVLSDNTLYGTALKGGSSSNGTVFAVSTDGTGFTVLHSFKAIINGGNSDGAQPNPVILSGNTLFGSTLAGGSDDYGTVFAVNTNGTGFRTLHSFLGSDGIIPYAGLISSGNRLYGTTGGGGISGGGTVFAIDTDGNGFTILSSLSGDADGFQPYAGLVLSANTLYGTTVQGGISGEGTLFAVNTDGTGFRVVYNFLAAVGTGSGALVLSGNTLYGAGNGTLFAVNTNGTGFTTLYSFTGGSDGRNPGGLILSGSTLYGAAAGAAVRGMARFLVFHCRLSPRRN